MVARWLKRGHRWNSLKSSPALLLFFKYAAKNKRCGGGGPREGEARCRCKSHHFCIFSFSDSSAFHTYSLPPWFYVTVQQSHRSFTPDCLSPPFTSHVGETDWSSLFPLPSLTMHNNNKIIIGFSFIAADVNGQRTLFTSTSPEKRLLWWSIHNLNDESRTHQTASSKRA